MTLRSFYGPPIEIPALIIKGQSSVSSIAATMDAANEQVHLVGHIVLEGGSAGGPKTISSAGGKIHWRSGAVTWAAAGTTVRLGIQDLSTATSPAQGDGTHDVYEDLVQGTDTVAANTAYATAMGSGTKTIAHGDKIAVAFEMTVRNGSDSVVTTQYNPAYAPSAFQLPAVMLGTPTFARQVAFPSVVIEFNDGTIGWVAPSCPILGGFGSASFHVNTSTADEYGNIFSPVAAMRSVGIVVNITPSSAAADFEICLYSDPLGTPVLIEAIAVDATQLGNPAGFTGGSYFFFSTEITLSVGTAYGITVRPTTTTSLITYYQDVSVAAHWKAISLDDTCYAIRRLDNAGAFSDYNGGTAKTRRMNISLLVDQFDDGAGGGGGGGMLQGNFRGNFQ